MEQSEPSARPLLSARENEPRESSERTRQMESHAVSGVMSTAQKSNSTERMASSKSASRPAKQSPTIPAHSDLDSKKSSKTVKRFWGQSWTVETLSLVVSVLGLAGLVATLLAHEYKPLPQWPQLVTINSIISLFSLLMRTCVGVVLTEGIGQCKWNWYRKAKKLDHIERLDSASHGSWGSLNLLYHSRPMQTCYLAAIGAIITIMSSLVGFFSQQLVQFQDCLQKDPTALVNISRANSYSRIGNTMQNNVPVQFAPMAAATHVGLLQPTGDLTNVLSSGCSSGNCTFLDADSASFSTLAFSHSCTDITSGIRLMNETHSNTTGAATTYYTIDYDNNGTLKWMADVGGEPVVRSWLPSPQLEAFTVYFLFRSANDESDWRAANCSLFPTVNTYAASIKDSKLKEQLVDRVYLQPLHTQFQDPPVSDYNLTDMIWSFSHGMTANYTLRNGTRESCEGSDSERPGTSKFMQHSNDTTYVNGTGYTHPSAGWKWSYFPMDCIWLISKFAYMTISEGLEEVFDNQNLTMGRHRASYGSVHLNVLFEEGNITVDTIDKRMDYLATSMTSILRTHGDVNYPEEWPEWMPYVAEGEMWVNTTCVYVRWAWITFPAVEIILSGIFLVLVAIDSRGIEPDRLWKSSFLAALFCEVEVDQQPVGKEEMKEVAKSTSVSLAATSSGLRLIR